jgi:hypothetical protein
MREAGAVIGVDGSVLYWHTPVDRTVGSLPDSRDLWGVLWQHREELAGVAHSHPGAGIPHQSWEDSTTFAAIESALGKRLAWYIASADHVVLLRWAGTSKYSYDVTVLETEPPWTEALRRLSDLLG